MTQPWNVLSQFETPEPLFVGRQAELAWAAEHLARGQSPLLVYGAPRVGKTALLRHLADVLQGDYLAVYLDAGRARTWNAAGSPLLQIAGQVGRCAREQLGASIAAPESAPFVEDPVRAWDAFLDDLERQVDAPLVLLVDNADHAAPDWLSAMVRDNLRLVLAAEDRDRLVGLLPPMAVAPPSLVLNVLDHESAEALAKALVTPRVQLDPWATRRILELTSHHPYYIHLFCRVLLECCVQRSPLTPTDVEEALTCLLGQPVPEFVDAWESLSPREQYVLALLGGLRGHGGIATQYDLEKASTRYGRAIASYEIIEQLQRLVERGILERLGTNSYRFVVELYRLWVRENHPPGQVVRRGGWSTGWAGADLVIARLRSGFARRWTLWVSLAIVAVVAVVFALQPALRQRPVDVPATVTAASALRTRVESA